MANSFITKRALAEALKQLMKEVPFNKINIADICEKCGMNRKSFYYHFKDKYDLVNWIFDTEFVETARNTTYKTQWELIGALCDYFYKNKDFYRYAFEIQGQNSFSEHFFDTIKPLLYRRIKEVMPDEEILDYQIIAIAEFFVIITQKWITEKDCVPPEKFQHSVKTMVEKFATQIHNEIGKNDI